MVRMETDLGDFPVEFGPLPQNCPCTVAMGEEGGTDETEALAMAEGD